MEGIRWLPGSLHAVVGVQVDWGCDRDELEVRLDSAGTATLRASGYPRPIPGIPPARNLAGASFAVANVTGFLARLLEGEQNALGAEDLVRALLDMPARLAV